MGTTVKKYCIKTFSIAPKLVLSNISEKIGFLEKSIPQSETPDVVCGFAKKTGDRMILEKKSFFKEIIITILVN